MTSIAGDDLEDHLGTVAEGVREAFRLISGGDAETIATTLRTLRVAVESATIASAVGIPLGLLLGTGHSRWRSGLTAISNAGLALPPVAIGQILWILMWPRSRWGGGPLAGLGWLYTLDAVILAQTLLAMPVVAVLTAAAARSVPAGLADQARSLGAGRVKVAILMLRESRQGIAAAVIAALGTAIATVGAILIVGTSLGQATLATATVTAWNSGGNDARAIACGTILITLFALLAALLTLLQLRRPGWLALRPS